MKRRRRSRSWPHEPRPVDQSDSGLTAEQVALLNESYVLEGRLEHASPDVDPEEVREQVERLREELPKLIESIYTWLKSYEISFSASSILR